jgi:hypothetical protein
LNIMTRTLISIIVLGVITAAGPAAAAPEKSAAAPAAKKTPSIRTEGADAGDLSGKVVETMDAAGYTYVCLEKGGTKTWVAVPQMKVAKGSTMSFLPGQTMTSFESKSLNRTFDRIVFSGGPAGGEQSMPPGHPGIPSDPAGSTGSKSQVSSKDKSIKVEKAAGANAYTVAEVYAKRTSLDKKKISVRGRVVKVSQGIMSRNWVHLQDGTGEQEKGTHNLVATTRDLPAVGDTVTATGTFAKDKDFGAGYLYKAIIEDATVAK